MSTGDEPAIPEKNRTARPRHRRRLWAAAAVGIVLLAGIAARLATFSATPPPISRTDPSVQRIATAPRSASDARGASKTSRTAASLAPNGTFETLDANAVTVAALHGKDTTVAALRGKPTLLWFLVTGCSSCAASAPAIAKYLPNLEADGVHVVGLDLYGDLPSTPPGLGQFAAWAASNAGPAWSSSDWTWGMASKELSLAYDPGGAPDLYVLIGPGGHLRYRNNTPVSTMGQLLAAAAHMTGQTAPTGRTSAAGSTSTAATLP